MMKRHYLLDKINEQVRRQKKDFRMERVLSQDRLLRELVRQSQVSLCQKLRPCWDRWGWMDQGWAQWLLTGLRERRTELRCWDGGATHCPRPTASLDEWERWSYQGCSHKFPINWLIGRIPGASMVDVNKVPFNRRKRRRWWGGQFFPFSYHRRSILTSGLNFMFSSWSFRTTSSSRLRCRSSSLVVDDSFLVGSFFKPVSSSFWPSSSSMRIWPSVLSPGRCPPFPRRSLPLWPVVWIVSQLAGVAKIMPKESWRESLPGRLLDRTRSGSPSRPSSSTSLPGTGGRSLYPSLLEDVPALFSATPTPMQYDCFRMDLVLHQPATSHRMIWIAPQPWHLCAVQTVGLITWLNRLDRTETPFFSLDPK